MKKITIVCDDTVHGLQVLDTQVPTLTAHLMLFRIFAIIRYEGRSVDSFKNKVYCDDEGSVQLDCYDAPPSAVLEKLSLRAVLPLSMILYLQLLFPCIFQTCR